MLAFVLACNPTAVKPSKFFGQSDQQTADAKTETRGTDELSADADMQEGVLPPANISGSYLIDCTLFDTQKAQTSPAQVNFACGVSKKTGGAVASDGQWKATLLDPTADETLQTRDAKAGLFLLTTSKPEQLVTTMNRVTVSFDGTIEGKKAFLTETGQRTLSRDIAQVQNLIIRTSFTVQIVSGSRTGLVYTGSFQYDSSLLTGAAQETLEAQNLQFNYLPAQAQQFDSKGILTFASGRFVSLIVAGGPGTQRFGINTGFDRNQFGRPEEAFVINGGQFFGYLATDGFVDGAGTIRYSSL
jgi:hypothetical protein